MRAGTVREQRGKEDEAAVAETESKEATAIPGRATAGRVRKMGAVGSLSLTVTIFRQGEGLSLTRGSWAVFRLAISGESVAKKTR